MKISLIAAMAQNHVIGKDNDLPWSLPDDMKYFMDTTKGHHCIMGRKNYDSIPVKFRPLTNRTNIVVTRQQNLQAPGCVVVNSVDDALTIARNNGEPEAFVIGGAEIYKTAFAVADRLYLTEIAAVVNGDVHFPDFAKADWTEVSRKHHTTDARHLYAFDYVVYERVR